ncbi:alpha/beta fold hydrolase [Ulvibacterium sp.]|uniref:alpha/beta fold hydrolase n=1 Tax=Ulvibacterium sp. TaxID=2665914 RepID=UPI003BA9A895
MKTLNRTVLILFVLLSIKNARAQNGNYAPTNGLNTYYELHGEKTDKQPIVILHGAYATLSLWGDFLTKLSKDRQVIAMDFQGHGRTADIDRPITYENLADDVAALIEHLKLEKADVFGYSMGGGVALQLGIRHPQLINKMVVASASYKSEGMYPELTAMIGQMKPEYMEGTPFKRAYDSLSPNPENFPVLMKKLIALDESPQDWPAEKISKIPFPILFINGDADVVRPEHTVEMYRLKGGGPTPDFMSAPQSQLAILPGTTHVGVMERTDWLMAMVPLFLDAKPPSD